MSQIPFEYTFTQGQESFYIQLLFKNPILRFQIQNLNTPSPKFWKSDFQFDFIQKTMPFFKDIISFDSFINTLPKYFEDKNISIKENNGHLEIYVCPQKNTVFFLIKNFAISRNNTDKIYEENLKIIDSELKEQKKSIQKIDLDNEFIKKQTLELMEQVFKTQKLNENIVNNNTQLKATMDTSLKNQQKMETEIGQIKNALSHIYNFLNEVLCNQIGKSSIDRTSVNSKKNNQNSKYDKYSDKEDLKSEPEIKNNRNNESNFESHHNYKIKSLKSEEIKPHYYEENKQFYGVGKDREEEDEENDRVEGLQNKKSLVESQMVEGTLLTTDIISNIKDFITEYGSFNQSLLYKASVHGDSVKEFHKRVREVKSTLVIIQTDSGEVFGGYTSETWDSQLGIKRYKSDNKAFIFSSNKVHPVQSVDKALGVGDTIGPCFGDDIVINDHFLTKKNNVIGFPAQYKPSRNQNPTEFNRGEKTFKVKELEIYKIVTYIPAQSLYNNYS